MALVATPVAALAAGAPGPTIACCATLASMALVKRVMANGAPDASVAVLGGVWLNRLLLDRDIRDRDAWVRRGREDSQLRRGDAEIDAR